MKKDFKRTGRIRYAAKCMAMAVAFTLALQPYFTFSAWAYVYDGSGYYWEDDGGSGLTNVSKTYDDGTKYTAEYKYDEADNLISCKVQERDGSKYILERRYSDGSVVYKKDYYYIIYGDNDFSETTEIMEYLESGRHETSVYKSSDGTSSVELWYNTDDDVVKAVEIDSDGTTDQQDTTYNEQRQPLTVTETSSDGSSRQEEWQYDESGQIIYHKNSEYSADGGIRRTEETRLEDENYHTTQTIENEGDSYIESEIWRRAKDSILLKEVSTSTDGTQITENYTYNEDGNEILYTLSGSDGTSGKRETSYTYNGQLVAYSDNLGNHQSSSIITDPSSGQITNEEEVRYADGSSWYFKKVTSVNYDTVYSMYRQKTSDGVETYSEQTVDMSGSVTLRDKDSDGSITVRIFDENGRTISNKTTRSNGDVSESSFEYDEFARILKVVETRSNGISAVTQYQRSGEDSETLTVTTTFSSGYEVSVTETDADNGDSSTEVTYSSGEVVQDIVVGIYGGKLSIKTIYRDGRIEEETGDENMVDEEEGAAYQKLLAVNKRHTDFLDLAWGTISPQDTASDSNAVKDEATDAQAVMGEMR